MKLLQALIRKEQPKTNMYLLILCLCLNILLSTASAKPVGKGIGINNPHAKPHSNIHVNPAGIITGSGGQSINSAFVNQNSSPISHNAANIGAVSIPKGLLSKSGGDTLLLGQPGSNIIVQVYSPSGSSPAMKPINQVKNNPRKTRHILLAAGDVFSQAITNLNMLSSPLEVPDQIGAKGANPGHGGNHPNKGYGNPGGGNGKGNWGKGNKGNGVGNSWTGNQGRGVGEGMASVANTEEPEPPELPDTPGSNNEPYDEPYIEPAPLQRPAGWAPEEEEFANGGCPALMNWLATELDIEGKNIQVSVAEAFASSTDIQACEAAAKLLDRAKILNDPNGTGASALARVLNEFLPQDAPISEEHLAVIAEILEAHNDDSTHYATAGRWLDALVDYVLILKNEMDWSADNATTFVIDKYFVSTQQSDEAGLISYVTACLMTN